MAKKYRPTIAQRIWCRGYKLASRFGYVSAAECTIYAKAYLQGWLNRSKQGSKS